MNKSEQFHLYRLTNKKDTKIINDIKLLKSKKIDWYLVNNSSILKTWVWPVNNEIELKAYHITEAQIEKLYNIHDQNFSVAKNKNNYLMGLIIAIAAISRIYIKQLAELFGGLKDFNIKNHFFETFIAIFLIFLLFNFLGWLCRKHSAIQRF